MRKRLKSELHMPNVFMVLDCLSVACMVAWCCGREVAVVEVVTRASRRAWSRLFIIIWKSRLLAVGRGLRPSMYTCFALEVAHAFSSCVGHAMNTDDGSMMFGPSLL